MIPLGFEPKTHSLEGCCSIQLSYGTDTLHDPVGAMQVQKYENSGLLQTYSPIF